MNENYRVIRFHFEPIEGEDPAGTDVFVQMRMPMTYSEHDERVCEMEDAISSYIETRDYWNFASLARDVAQRFDPDARVIELTTFVI